MIMFVREHKKLCQDGACRLNLNEGQNVGFSHGSTNFSMVPKIFLGLFFVHISQFGTP